MIESVVTVGNTALVCLPVAQSLARWTSNPKVECSSHSGVTNFTSNIANTLVWSIQWSL